MAEPAVQLTPVEREVLELEVRENGCKVCVRSLQFGDGHRVCRTGLKFPYCRKDKKKGFKLNDK